MATTLKYLDGHDLFVGDPYPNPSGGKFRVEILSSQQIEVRYYLCDLSGRLASSKKKQLLVSGKSNLLIETRGLAQGCYLLNIETDNSLVSRPVIKK
jgi:hypothetical protein